MNKREIDKIILLIFFSALLIIGIILSFQNKPTTAGLTYTTAILCMIFAKLSSFKKFKGLGIEAELLEEKIEKADLLIRKLKDFSLPTAELLISNVARTGRWGGIIPRKKKSELLESIEKSLTDIGISEIEIDKIKKDWHWYNLFDMGNNIFNNFNKLSRNKIDEKNKYIEEISRPIVKDHEEHSKRVEDWRNASQWLDNFNALRQQKDLNNIGKQIKDYINICPYLTNEEKEKFLLENKEEIEDMLFYERNHSFRRPEIWFNEEED